MRSSRSVDPLNPGPAGFAHRGRHGPFPFVENSLTAFAACLEMGAGVECDVRLTADKRIVVFHEHEQASSDPLSVHPANFVEWRSRALSFEALALAQAPPLNVTRADMIERLLGCNALKAPPTSPKT